MYINLKAPLRLSSIVKPTHNIVLNRTSYRIAVIDNEPFPYTEELRAHGFNISELGDIRDFAAVAEYPIVACDILDVGIHFGASHQGAHVIGEIRKRYPGSFLIAYSGGTFGPTFKTYWDMCDVFLRRDGGFDQWVTTLDAAIGTIGDPVRHWHRINRLLLDSDVSAFEVYRLEQAYIKSILKKTPYYLEREIEHAKKSGADSETIEKVGTGLIVSVKLLAHLLA